MKKPSKSVMTVVVVVTSIAIVLGVKFFIQSQQSDLKFSASARVKGSQQAPIQIIEFIDFECPMCAQGAAYLKTIMKENPELFRIEMKYYPLKMHRHSFSSALYSECAARQGKFWAYHDYLIERQDQWKRLVNAKPAFELIAQEVDLDLKKLNQCLEDQTVMDFILENKKQGDALGVDRTPTYFINDKMVVGIYSLRQELNRLFEEYKN